MRAILSPARNIVLRPFSGVKPLKPIFSLEAAQIAETLAVHNVWELEGLLDVNSERAFELHADFQRFKDFDWDGYRFIPSRSDCANFVFIRV